MILKTWGCLEIVHSINWDMKNIIIIASLLLGMPLMAQTK